MLPKNFYRYPPEIHDYIVIGYVIFFVIVCLTAITLIFCLTKPIFLIVYLFPVMLSWGMALIVMFVLYNIVTFVHKIRKTETKLKCKQNMLIGLTAIFLVGIEPRVMTFCFLYQPVHPFATGYLLFLSLFIMPILYYLFISESKVKCVVVNPHHKKIAQIIGSIHFLILMITILIGSFFEQPKVFNVIAAELILSLICASTMIEFVAVLKGTVELRRVKDVQEMQTLNCAADIEGDAKVLEIIARNIELVRTRLECKICFQHYYKNRIPRMLKECGHTVCEKCADMLLEMTHKQHVFCPFCQKVTLVHGPASLLPKNFTILDMIAERE
ncbi:hypothetical protein GCK72_016492 [Caenorhabditis remanei]|uniref:RING-type domain-containing protein n=1 Tax=Caenorhabditis remanei TaxID=31234 RepID=A0A6A5G4S5_CAERE|nr:hypothetical protein GCK72_016492 [Caenorhabditis remanei]KAF1749947.1 hypothetical protein GCK72_016492 [Caenorhabditis remanei]